MTDLDAHINLLCENLQGKKKTLIEAKFLIETFLAKFNLFIDDISYKCFKLLKAENTLK